VAGRVDDQQARQAHVKGTAGTQRLRASLDGLCRHEGGADLLRDAARLAVLRYRARRIGMGRVEEACAWRRV
jgi:hypothetical protein